ncbi:reverse transcriptase-like protein [Desertibacillus haloalkaliphilus]|uniref:reverse transcriptase-like protein n=1 Tax=Desertibacillus haloalkaliphilus TaxID=1328930 RepID=UPI001C271600|nr:reverse transcriptase-like protein [Desertibacillus haloalkaliphilus]MBU8907442.1 reverse transcriptase-like protein [Desertibacillus haloalkaliphilus]
MKVRLEWVYQPVRGKKRMRFLSDYVTPEEALFFYRDIERTGRVKSLEFYDATGMQWLKKELEKLVEQIETEPHAITAYFDGGHNRETHTAGLGTVIYYEKDGKSYRIRKNDRFEEIETNNEAEYAALWLLLLELEELEVHHTDITIKGDSQVVLNQLTGEWPTYEEHLNRWLDRIEEKLKTLGLTPNYILIPRKENQEADRLASQALEGTPIASHLTIDEKESGQN